MNRKQLPQISNQLWFPGFLRNNVHEFMTWFVDAVHAAKPFMPVIEKGLQNAPEKRIINIDLNFAAGIETLKPYLANDIQVESVTDTNSLPGNKGLVTFINCFHQLDQRNAKNWLEKIVETVNPVAVVEGNNDSLWQVFGMMVIVPLTVIFTAPFVKPFRLSRIIFSWLIPILPVVTFIDGFLALFKLYAPDDLDELVSKIDSGVYVWESGKLDNGRGGKIIYLLGIPKMTAS